MKIPFSLTRKGLLLSGKDREKARIEYELKGEEKDRALLALEYDTDELKNLDDYKLKKLKIDRQYDKISQVDYEIEIIRLNLTHKSDIDVQIDELNVLLNHKKIDGVEYCKRKNDLLKKPWVAIKTNPDMEDDDGLEIEVAYNKTFIEKMRAKGLPGDKDEEIAEQWLKLFFISNLDEDDLRMVDEEIAEEKKISGRHRLPNKSTFIG